MKTLIALTLFATAGLLAATAQDLTFDGGFEDTTRDGGLRGWRVNASAGYPFETVEVVRGDPRYVRSGESSVKLVQAATDEAGKPKSGHLYSNSAFPVKPGERYVLSVWAKGNGILSAWVYQYKLVDGNESHHSGVDLAVVNREESDGNAGAYSLADGGPWKQCRFTYVVSAKDVVSARPVLAVHGTVYLDDVTFEKDKASAP